jgi:uncharacterized protein (DUF488 family)
VALEAAGIDVFIDVRQRRGVRGSRYSFANASRLQAELSARGINYSHIRDLAPSTDTRQLQKLADAAVGTTKAERQALTPAFIAAYEERNTKPFDWDDLVAALGKHNAPVIFCVERTPDACHRSLVARRLAQATHAQVQHLMP